MASDTAGRGRFLDEHAVAGPGRLRLLSSDALFELKSRLLTKRTASRDIFDLWFYLSRLGRPLDEVIAFAQAENPYHGLPDIKRRLMPAALPKP